MMGKAQWEIKQGDMAGDIKKIELSQGKHALVDDCDYEFLKQWNWVAHYSKSTNGFYADRSKYVGHFNGKNKRKTISMHRLIMKRIIGRELKKSEVVDHINHDPLDNRRENLRIVTRRQNTQNKKTKGTSKYPGVYWNKEKKKWKAEIRLEGKKTHLGYFSIEKEAAKAYEQALREHVGEELVCKLERV